MQKQDKSFIKNTANLFNLTIICILLFSVLFSLAVNIYATSTGIKIEDIQKNDFYICLSYMMTSVALTLALFSYSIKNKTPFLKVFECEKPSLKSVIATLLITFGMLFGLSNVNELIFEFAKNIGLNVVEPSLPEFSTLNFISILIFVCLLPPILEEIIFRNILFKNFSKHGTMLAILFTSLIFSLYHMSITQTVYQFIVGVLFSLIILNGGNYLLTAISHFINNLFVVLNYYFFNIKFSSEVDIVVTILALISLIIGVVLLFINNKQKFIKSNTKSVKQIFLSCFLGISICILFWIVGLF